MWRGGGRWRARWCVGILFAGVSIGVLGATPASAGADPSGRFEGEVVAEDIVLGTTRVPIESVEVSCDGSSCRVETSHILYWHGGEPVEVPLAGGTVEIPISGEGDCAGHPVPTATLVVSFPEDGLVMERVWPIWNLSTECGSAGGGAATFTGTRVDQADAGQEGGPSGGSAAEGGGVDSELCGLLRDFAEGALALGPDPDEAFRVRDLLQRAALDGRIAVNALDGVPPDVRASLSAVGVGVDEILPALDVAALEGGEASADLAMFHETYDADAQAVLEYSDAGCAALAAAGSASPVAVDAERVSELTGRQVESIAAVARGDRSVVPAALATPGEAATGASRTVVNLALAGIAVLLLVFPSQLFNATWSEHHDRVESWWRRRLPGGDPERARRRRVGVVPFAVTVVAGAVIGGFLDPAFGVTSPSLALVAGVVISTAVAALIAGRAAVAHRSTRGLSVDLYIEAIPSGLVIAVACVVLSRLVEFRPGYLFGLVGGLVFASRMSDADEGRQELTATLAAITLALGAWFLAVPVGEVANQNDPTLVVQVADSALSALFIGGIEGLLIGLVPLQLLPGHTLFTWSRSVWAAVTFGVCFLFLQVLLRPAAGYLGASTTASVTVTAALFVGFGAASVAFWAWFQLRPDPPSTSAPDPNPVLEDIT